MALALHKAEVGLKDVGHAVTVPNDPRAKLMYYLNTVTDLLEVESSGHLQKLCDFKYYWRLDDDDVDTLVILCLAISPDILIGKCMFQDDEMCRGHANKIYELSAVSRTMVVSESIVIDGQRRRVKKIMAFQMEWLRRNYVEPMQHFESRLRRIAQPARRPRSRKGCVVM